MAAPGFGVHAFDAPPGADVLGLDLSQPLDDDTFEQVHSAHRAVPFGEPVGLAPGDLEAVSPRLGDIHRVRDRFGDRTSIGIPVCGANIGAA